MQTYGFSSLVYSFLWILLADPDSWEDEATARNMEFNPVLSFELVAYVKKIYTRASHDYSMCVLHHTLHQTPVRSQKYIHFVATLYVNSNYKSSQRKEFMGYSESIIQMVDLDKTFFSLCLCLHVRMRLSQTVWYQPYLVVEADDEPQAGETEAKHRCK